MRQPCEALVVLRARALFASDLPTNSRPTPAERDDAIRDAFRTHDGFWGCLTEMAFAFGNHPETAQPRMRWARDLASMTDADQVQSTSETPGERPDDDRPGTRRNITNRGIR